MEITDFDDVFDEMIRLYESERYEELIALTNRALKVREFQNDPIIAHLLYARKAESQVDLKRYGYAVTNARRATELCPTCPYSQSVYLQALECYAQKNQDVKVMSEAIALARKITRRSVDRILADPCMKKKKSVAIGFVADAWFLLGHLYVLKGDKSKAVGALEKYLVVSRKGRYTDFTAEEAMETLEAVRG